VSSIAPNGVQISDDGSGRAAALQLTRRAVAMIADVAEREAQQFPLWIPVALGCGIACWFLLPDAMEWIAAGCGFAGIALAGFALRGRLRLALGWFGVLALAGLALTWVRAELVAAPRIMRPMVIATTGRVERIEHLAGRGVDRLTILADGDHQGLRMRVSFPIGDLPPITPGARLSFRARLMPPAPPAVPGGYDFARMAWFRGIGASGTALGHPRIIERASPAGFWQWVDGLRAPLTAHLQSSIGGDEGGIAAALVTGDQGGVSDDAAQALRDAGLAHLLSISGLHVAAVIGFVMLASRRLIALSPHAAIHWPVTLIAAALAATAGVAYSLLAGGEVPTIRSCIAALLVLVGLALGREAITLRMVAAGAFLILLFRPEALIGASFQLSFAAVVAIVAINEWPWLREKAARREEAFWAAGVRAVAALLISGAAVEIALAPIGLYHFNRMGLYGALANIIAIPLTTFVIMPVEAITLVLDMMGMGAPFHILLHHCIALLIALARWAASLPGGVALAPSMATGGYALIIIGGLWLCLWRTRLRLLGLLPIAAGTIWCMATPAADIYITGDGRHLAVRGTDDQLWLLRDRTGDYIRDVIGNTAGTDQRARPIDQMPNARCSADACLIRVSRVSQTLTLLATRTPVLISRKRLEPACAASDLVISDRRLPYWCRPRWLKADRAFLDHGGGLAISLASARVKSVGEDAGAHPWANAPQPVFTNSMSRSGHRPAGAVEQQALQTRHHESPSPIQPVTVFSNAATNP